MKIYFKDLASYKRDKQPAGYFAADAINWCERNIGSRDWPVTRETCGWSSIPYDNNLHLIFPPPIGIDFVDEASATAFLLVFA